jgi:hypothetical protein
VRSCVLELGEIRSLFVSLGLHDFGDYAGIGHQRPVRRLLEPFARFVQAAAAPARF